MPTSMPLIISILAFFSCLLLSWGIFAYVGRTNKSREMVKKDPLEPGRISGFALRVGFHYQGRK